MALDKEYFDAINIDIVKKKYYNANKVNALLDDIYNQALALSAENQRLKTQLAEAERRRDEIGDTLLTAQAAARDIISKAKAQAARLLDEAQKRQSQLLSGAADQQEYMVSQVGQAFDRLKKQQLENVDMLNGMWQEFLCGLAAEESPAREEPEAPPAPARPVLIDEKKRISELESMVTSIARELSEIMGG